jgi:hypothetical protein
MCGIGNAKIMGIKNTAPRLAVNWYVTSRAVLPSDFSLGSGIITQLLSNDVARTVGKIFDQCWRADDTVLGSAYCVTNNKMRVAVRGA